MTSACAPTTESNLSVLVMPMPAKSSCQRSRSAWRFRENRRRPAECQRKPEERSGLSSERGHLKWWRRQDSNLRPSACKADALPLSYAPGKPQNAGSASNLGSLQHGVKRITRWWTMLQHRWAKVQLRSTNAFALVDLSGFEPLTLRLSGVRSNQLSYRSGRAVRHGAKALDKKRKG